MIRYRIDRHHRLVEVVGAELLDPAEITAIEVQIRDDPAFDPTFALLVDFSAASFAAVMSSDTHQHAQVHPFDPESPCAIVVRKDYDAGIVRLFAALTELQGSKAKVRSFRDRESALAWIDESRVGAAGSDTLPSRVP